MGFWTSVTSIFDKLLPSRKAALLDQLNQMTADYYALLKAGKDSEAAALRVQLRNLRTKAGVTDGDV
jgi:hypothetical protein